MNEHTTNIPNEPKKMRTNTFQNVILRREKITGWIYFPIHIIVLPLLLPLLLNITQENTNSASMVNMNVWYYAIGIVFLGIFLFHFYKENFSVLIRDFKKVETTLLIGIALLMAGNIVVNLIVYLIGGLPESPNQAAVEELTKDDKTRMFVIAVLFAPIVEETLFRGLVFGTIRTKNRAAAYVVSTVLFCIYHVWQYAVSDGSIELMLTAIVYIPISVVLAFCYDRSGTIWTSTIFHMANNAASLFLSASTN